MSALSGSKIIISLIVAIVVWLIGRYFLYWLPGGMLVSILLSIAGAILLTTVADNVAREMNASVSSVVHAVVAAVGSATLLFGTMSALTVSNAVVTINCSRTAPSANPDYVYIKAGSTVKWTAADTSSRSFTVRFKDQSPFDDVITGTQLKIISSNPTTGETATNTIKDRPGAHRYGFTCSNGTVVDPMIDVWK